MMLEVQNPGNDVDWPKMHVDHKDSWEMNDHGEYGPQSIGFELSCMAIPYEHIIEVLDKLPYASPTRVYIEFLFLTGCRPSEADEFTLEGKDSFIKGNFAFWRVGKNQKGMWRKEFLPSFFLAELQAYRSNTKLYKDKLFPTKSKSATKIFNRSIRPKLSEAWQVRVATPKHKGERQHHAIHEYSLQLKGLRKAFATLVFWKYWDKYGSATTAVDMTVKRLRHSFKGITVGNYIENSERLNMAKWKGRTPSEIIALSTQRQIQDYDLDWKKIRDENEQARLPEFINYIDKL